MTSERKYLMIVNADRSITSKWGSIPLNDEFAFSGRLFDKNGNAKDWWSYSSEENFELKAYCLVNQYNSYEVFGEYVSETRTSCL